jgi:hypothetical protein
MKLYGHVLRAPASVKTALPEAARALEHAWQQRRQELAGWQPSGGWLIDTRSLERRNALARWVVIRG